MLIHWNGAVTTVEQSRISPLDHGFLYGHGLFETLRVYHGQPFAWDRHYRRLQAGATLLEWPKLPRSEDLDRRMQELLTASGLVEASIRLTLSRGAGAPRPDPSSCGSLSVVIFAQAYTPPPAEVYQRGWSLQTTGYTRNQQSPLCRLKSANYLENLLAKQAASRSGAKEALFLNTRGTVAEGTMSNLFIVEKGCLLTPDIASGLLPGITREIILELARKSDLDVSEEPISLQRAMESDEVFLSSSLLEIMPVTLWDGQAVGGDGNITQQLRQLYREQVQKGMCDNG
ncbi:MAG TPA: aminodeoxychorismate lyase [Patescibacteria group bacterium]|nr:aminodeoxychorismate lyase [Patescibacteria group bacterium]